MREAKDQPHEDEDEDKREELAATPPPGATIRGEKVIRAAREGKPEASAPLDINRV
jgi:hypothetical protein